MAELCYFVPASTTVFDNWRRIVRQQDQTQTSTSFTKTIVLRCTKDIQIILVAPTTPRFTLSIQEANSDKPRKIVAAENITIKSDGNLQCIISFIPPETESTDFFYDNFQDAVSVQTLPQRTWVTHRVFGLARQTPRASDKKPTAPEKSEMKRGRPSPHQRKPSSIRKDSVASTHISTENAPNQDEKTDILASLELQPSADVLADQATAAAAKVLRTVQVREFETSRAGVERVSLQQPALKTQSANVLSGIQIGEGESAGGVGGIRTRGIGLLEPIRHLKTSPGTTWDLSASCDSVDLPPLHHSKNKNKNNTNSNVEECPETSRSIDTDMSNSDFNDNTHTEHNMHTHQPSRKSTSNIKARIDRVSQTKVPPPAVVAVNSLDHAKAIITQLKRRSTSNTTRPKGNDVGMPLEKWDQLVIQQGLKVQAMQRKAAAVKRANKIVQGSKERSEEGGSEREEGEDKDEKQTSALNQNVGTADQEDRQFFLDWLDKEKTKKVSLPLQAA